MSCVIITIAAYGKFSCPVLVQVSYSSSQVRDWDRPANTKGYTRRLDRIRRDNAALLQTNNLRFAQIDDNEVIGFIKESVARDNAVAVAVALTKAGPREFWFHFGDIEIGPSTS